VRYAQAGKSRTSLEINMKQIKPQTGPSSTQFQQSVFRSSLKHMFMAVVAFALGSGVVAAGELENNFVNPPDSARPGVYWYFLNGNLNGKEMTADLESMKAAGLGNLVFLEVDIGTPVGPVAFMSPKWQELFVQAVRDAERLGIDITLGIGPGWCGSGGPWVKPEQAMQHLVFSTVELKGPQNYSAVLPLPTQRSTQWHNMGNPFYEDVAVLAFPSCKPLIADIDEKALFFRNPFSSMAGVKPYLSTSANYVEPSPTGVIQPGQIVELTKQLKPDGTLDWHVPTGDWTIVRMGRRVTGASTRPAPSTAIGLESDKFDAKALEEHLSHFVGVLLDKMSPRAKEHGLTTLHMDSWESGAQNWTASFLEEFKKRRGYDARPWLLAYTGRAIESLEKSERFLWDLRLTAQELVLENHAGVVKKYGHKNGLSLSIEPYDMNPAGDLDLGAVADVPMAEFWNNTFNSAFSCFELSSVAHVMGSPIVSAEAFTSTGALDAYPSSLKNQGDWAFCVGINRFVFHTFAHQALGDAYKPGMSFGPYGVHWHRNQTWWPMVSDYHRYLTRCSELLRQGVTVSDVLYLTPEGAPQVFLPPDTAVDGAGGNMPDKKGYGFDGCSPKILMARAAVKNGLITFPGASSYRLMVLPQVETMTPALLAKIRDLVKDGATVVGTTPIKSPSLSGYPACDGEVQELAKDLWGSMDAPQTATKRSYGKGVIHWGGELSSKIPKNKIDSISASTWIWYPEGSPAQSAPPEKRYFQRIISVDRTKGLTYASAAVCADNSFILWVNGKKVLTGDSFHMTFRTSITSFLRPGVNVLAVEVSNVWNAPNPAGWIGSFDLNYKDGSREVIKTDKEWSAGLTAQPGWEQAATKPGDWKEALVLGAYAMAPWNRRGEGQLRQQLYPSYNLTAALLQEMGVKEDFTATGPVRYGHRRTEDRDIYFVANRTGAPIKADCRFRIGKGSAQLWDPVTGEQRPLPQCEHAEGLTVIPMEFDAFQSFFVVFENGNLKLETGNLGKKNFSELMPVQELTGSWTVKFDPKWGGPEKIAFETLQDWTTRPEPGIKYYSGIATYCKTFSFTQVSSFKFPVSKIFLDLGVVRDMARVKLNGQDLGVVWCAPWQVEVTSAIKAGNNQLEIEVVNRWANRLIGDKQPADANARTAECPWGLFGGQSFKTGRYTYGMYDPYKAQSPLDPSGLLGPVTLQIHK
jgi:hypothetical protein